MTTDSDVPPNAPPRQPWRRRFLARPATRLGRWAAWLAGAFLAMFVANAAVFMPMHADVVWARPVFIAYGLTMLLCGLAAGVTGLIAVTRGRERSWLAWLALLPGLFVLLLLLGEFLVPH